MAYVVVTFRGEEVARQELTGPAVVGRSPECDVSVRDILLSRRHCRIEPTEDGWAIEDLGSKNGTRLAEGKVGRAKLADGAVLSVGRTRIVFHVGEFIPGRAARAAKRQRPADPMEALSGTVEAFDYRAQVQRDTQHLPAPRPCPRDPASYRDEDVYSMLSGIASSSWDSIYAEASKPTASAQVAVAERTPRVATPRPRDIDPSLAPRRTPPPIDASLQVTPLESSTPATTTTPALANAKPTRRRSTFWRPLIIPIIRAALRSVSRYRFTSSVR